MLQINTLKHVGCPTDFNSRNNTDRRQREAKLHGPKIKMPTTKWISLCTNEAVSYWLFFKAEIYENVFYKNLENLLTAKQIIFLWVFIFALN